MDDDPATLDLMQEILATDGYEVVCVRGVSADLHEIVLPAPDLIIIDLLLSDDTRVLSGWDLVRLVKTRRGLQKVEIPVVSADYPSLRSHIAEAAEMDGVRLLSKPFSLDSLSVLVRDALREAGDHSAPLATPTPAPPRPPYPGTAA